jgi:hypothetical protein
MINDCPGNQERGLIIASERPPAVLLFHGEKPRRAKRADPLVSNINTVLAHDPCDRS